MSKLDRGLPSDLQDIAFLSQQGVIDWLKLEAVLEQALVQAVEFDLNRAEMRTRFGQLRV